MRCTNLQSHAAARLLTVRPGPLVLALLLGSAACAPGAVPPAASPPAPRATAAMPATAPQPDPRVGLSAGLWDAGEAVWNLRVVSTTPPPEQIVGIPNSDLAFFGDYVVQGSFAGFMIWDISKPAQPELVKLYLCPGSQGDVSVHGQLLFVSVEGLEGRLDCGTEGVTAVASEERLRGIRIFDISDVREPHYVANVQTCRGSHTHTLLHDPGDADNVYIYVSGATPVRPAEELAGCTTSPGDPASSLSRIEVIRVPLAQPQQAAIVSMPPILAGLSTPPRHGPALVDQAEIEAARARGEFVVRIEIIGEDMVLPAAMTDPMLAAIVQARGGSGTPTTADTAALYAQLEQMFDAGDDDATTICHDITVYPAIGLAGGACIGYGVLLDISDPAQPRRIAAVADSNFVAWHSATFNNDGTKLLFTDEWGGGLSPKCRATDPKEWGANAIFDIVDRQPVFRSYFKLPAPQTVQENCVAHNGSLIPIPGRDVMVQAWYQGGISVFDWTDAANPFEIAFHDRGPIDTNEVVLGGSWSAYWHNGHIVSSEIVRGLDILELVPSARLTQNEIDAAKSVRFDQFNPQTQPRFVWPASFALARAYVDQLERSNGLSAPRIAAVRGELAGAERAAGEARRNALRALATVLERDAGASADAAKVRMLVGTVRELATR